jgi:hypothetical protein
MRLKAFLPLLCCVLMLAGCGKDADTIEQVKNSITSFDSAVTLGEAFANYPYFNAVSWHVDGDYVIAKASLNVPELLREPATTKEIMVFARSPDIFDIIAGRIELFDISFRFIIRGEGVVQFQGGTYSVIYRDASSDEIRTLPEGWDNSVISEDLSKIYAAEPLTLPIGVFMLVGNTGLI